MKTKFITLVRLNLRDLWLGFGIVGLPWLLLHIITAGVMVIVRPDESIQISGILIPVCLLLGGFSMTSGNVLVTTDHALRMGRTRKEGFVLAMSLAAVLTASCTLLAGVLLWVERTLAMPVWRVLSGNPALRVDDFSCWWWMVPAAALGGMVLGLIYAALFTALGNKAAFVYMILWFGFLILTQALPWKTHTVVDLLIPFLAVGVVLALAWSVWQLLHLKIRS